MSCRISLIAAMARNRVIGRDNGIPWRLPAEMKWFKATTMGKPILMGRKTYESIGRPLPGRHNIVLTRNRDYSAEDCTVVHSIEEAISAAGADQELMIMGGAFLYEQFLSLADCLYLTFIEADIEGDAYFPEFSMANWLIVKEEFFQANEKNPYDYRIVVMIRQ
ncbi:MAG: type 3 dihydrofolate reductase, partial [candidate division Zixibacteria bacterium]|nr:type 3 dihydrofolate reductase [Phycisphaerae bacterium]NIR52286.1 type 3 dihydrofolate reductase [candidate division KSB1 bacterium]NIR67317.1 type 3 dihydrofolate reductase [candidate division Zixibacteria bacterium]NIW49424.1 type 3 dihydrofolate reductase [Gammaproteobacteria bacterium]NIP53336.1 type 3 dihydrofolate reductase [Phycisphaerae bacterium]